MPFCTCTEVSFFILPILPSSSSSFQPSQCPLRRKPPSAAAQGRRRRPWREQLDAASGIGHGPHRRTFHAAPHGAFSNVICSVAWTASHDQCLLTRVAGSRMACSPPCLSVGRRTSWGAEAIHAFARDALATSLSAVLLFDCDGVLVDTENVSHHISFNESFAEVVAHAALVAIRRLQTQMEQATVVHDGIGRGQSGQYEKYDGCMWARSMQNGV
ncbi:hypothetical protein GUJ93_ZPchr0011g28893 [Zizania palustris]|uniref:Uncharacterized protein n=1 Tax=Zizania palustris TaxID=103762 RepID=A0A8J5WD99_ZIZPA|nr:hypothetical protein GUJ93_ZPchr0011g28893 [Zizania palustris]